MKFLSVSLLVSLFFFIYVANTIWTLIELFIPPSCAKGSRCFHSYLAKKPVQHLVIFTSYSERPQNGEETKVYAKLNFDYETTTELEIPLGIPRKTRNNGTFHMHICLIDERKLYWSFQELQQSEPVETIPLIVFMEPQAPTFKLLNLEMEEEKRFDTKPVGHLITSIAFSVFTDSVEMQANKIPGELYPYLRISGRTYLPIIQYNILKTRLKNLLEIKKDTISANVTMNYSPISFGLMRLMLQIKMALQNFKTLGFSDKDVDDVKGMFADTNLYLLSVTVFIASFHLLFDFLAFKNDVSFWRGKKSMAGLSIRTVLWRAFSQCVILLYLLDEKTSMIVLVPASIGALIELWKAKKVLRIGIEWSSYKQLPKLVYHKEQCDSAELHTRAADAEAMQYLSYLLYPLCLAGAAYSLIYEPHKSWYSWSLHSLVNGVYAFGFLFMLPQLFVNYKLKSVAALPWRAFMYKAFNTFIDDIFAFIITMPTAHRVACFRDDIVFTIYLYQRWLYPVDITRIDDSTSITETLQVDQSKKQD